jgi:hypothetical protein
MNNNSKFIFTSFIVILFSGNSFSQNNFSLSKLGVVKNFISYKETMISPMQSIIVTSNDNTTQLQVLNSQDGKVKIGFQFPIIVKDDVVAASNKLLWVIGKKEMAIYTFGTKKKVATYSIPENANFTAAVMGFDNTLFALDATNNKIFRFNKTWELLAENDELKNANCILLNSSSLYVGTNNAIKELHIGNKKINTIAQNVPNVKAMSLDFFGNLVVLTNDFLARYTLDGEKLVLPTDVKNTSTAVVNSSSNKLFIVNENNELLTQDYLTAINETSKVWAAKNKRPMKPFANKDMMLVGSEFLYHYKDAAGKQIEDVKDGFYPEKGVFVDGEQGTFTASDKVMACAEKSYAAFTKWVAKLPKEFMATAKTTPPMFWLMVNDYSNIKDTLTEKKRPAVLWYWKRNPAIVGRVPGYWKWEATLTQDCKCEIPNEAEAIKYLESFLKK